MKIKEIEKNEWKEVLDLYFEEKKRCGDSVTIEDVLESMRRCESCGNLVMTDGVNDELPVCKTWKGEEVHCCDECFEDIMSDNEFTDDYDYYQDYMDHKLVSE